MFRREIIEEEMPVSLEMFKQHLRMTCDSFDSDLALKLRAAFNAAESFTGVIIMPSIFTIGLPFSSDMELGEYPISGIEYVKVDGIALGTDRYWLESGELHISPTITGEEIEVAYRAGLEYVPDDVKSAVLLIATSLFNNPADSVEGLPKASTNLLRPYRQWPTR